MKNRKYRILQESDLQEVIEAIRHSLTMREAARSLGIKPSTFIRFAQKYNIYKPNQAGKGIRKKANKLYSLLEILEGKYPRYQSSSLKRRLLSEKIKPAICEKCRLSKWLDGLIPLEVHHIDGDKYNHKLENLQILCPNCHALTNNYRAKNKRNKGELAESGLSRCFAKAVGVTAP